MSTLSPVSPIQRANSTSPNTLKWSEMVDDDDNDFDFDMTNIPNFDVPANAEILAVQTTPTKQVMNVSNDSALGLTVGKDSEEVTPIKGAEIIVDCSIPYKMKSMCAVTPTRKLGTVLHTTSTRAVAASVPLQRVQRAVEAVEQTLSENDDKLSYTELAKMCNWRARFQPSIGSMHTFLKNHPNVFEMRKGHVTLKPREALIKELIRMGGH